MLIPDVNVYIYAHRRDSVEHDSYRNWLERAALGPEPLGVSELVLSAFLRIVTNHRVYREPTSIETALSYCHALLDAPGVLSVRPGARHWPIFTDLCSRLRARANLVPDVYLAALVMEQGATLVTTDHGFGRFADLRVRHPLGPRGAR